MTSEWKPGDGYWLRAGVAVHRHGAKGIFGQPTVCTDPTCRRVAVIDPEDAEQVERLAKLLWPHYADQEHARLCKSEITANALRAFANPTPRIEEPTGLGAVVEDAEGRRWVLLGAGCGPGKDGWKQANVVNSPWRRFDEFRAVRILSPGVTP